MTFQLLAVAIYNKQGARRSIRFRPRALNVLTGESKTGKSAVLDIVDYCLGRNTITLPAGLISEVCSWCAILIEAGDAHLVLARPNPETASTNQAMIRVGGNGLDLPEFQELTINADTSALRNELNRRLGIEDFRIQPESGSLRYPYDISVAHAALLCLQKQTEIAGQSFLFHRQAEREIEQVLRDTLPYFLGASGPDVVEVQYRLRAAKRALARVERDIRNREAADDLFGDEIRSIGRVAFTYGLIEEPVLEGTVEEVWEELSRAVSFSDESSSAELSPDFSERREQLLLERADMRRDLDLINSQLSLLNSMQREEQNFSAELEIQHGRLRSLEIVPSPDGERSVCPLCHSIMSEPDATVDEIQALTESVSEELASVSRARPAQDRHIAELNDAASEIRSRMRDNALLLDELNSAESGILDEVRGREQRAFLRGRLANSMERIEGAEIRRPPVDLHRYTEAVAELESRLAEIDVQQEVSSREALIAPWMTEWAQRLQLEHSEYSVRLDVGHLTVVADTPSGAWPLHRIGSAENWIGYHLVAHLALHRWFFENDRPVPRFLMLDQPTQAFFPEEVRDATDVLDADWAAVRRQFVLLRDFVNLTDGGIQIIVCDHANLNDDWFQEALVDNWRGGVALVPHDWYS